MLRQNFFIRSFLDIVFRNSFSTPLLLRNSFVFTMPRAVALRAGGLEVSPNKTPGNTRHIHTGFMCAAQRAEESNARDSLFADPVATALSNGATPMGSWIMVPRTRFGDDFLVKKYKEGCRQLVLLGAGMDARAYRRFAKSPDAAPSEQNLMALPDLHVFEVDHKGAFDDKEPLLEGEEISVKSRTVLGLDFNDQGLNWGDELEAKGFNKGIPTVWLLEGLVYYLPSAKVTEELIPTIGRLSAPGSGLFHDSVTEAYPGLGIAPGGAPFLSGNNDYGKLWKEGGGFDGKVFVRNFESVKVDRKGRCLRLGSGRASEATANDCQDAYIVLFVTAEKNAAEGQQEKSPEKKAKKEETENKSKEEKPDL